MAILKVTPIAIRGRHQLLFFCSDKTIFFTLNWKTTTDGQFDSTQISLPFNKLATKLMACNGCLDTELSTNENHDCRH